MEAFFILEGQVERSKNVNGENCIFEMVEPGKAFGILHSLREDPSYATCVAKGNVKALTMTSYNLNSLLESDASLGRAFTNSLAKTVRNYTKLVRHPSSSRPRVVLYDSKAYWQQQFNKVNAEQNLGFEITYVTELLMEPVECSLVLRHHGAITPQKRWECRNVSSRSSTVLFLKFECVFPISQQNSPQVPISWEG